jgi:hypothetical protein
MESMRGPLTFRTAPLLATVAPRRRASPVLMPAIAALLLAAPLSAGNNPLQQLADALKQAAKQEVQNAVASAQEALESSALVSQIDDDARPSLVVETADGRVFQLRSLTLGPDVRLNAILGVASSLGFTSESGDSYVVNIEYPPVQPADGGGAANVVAGVLNGALQSNQLAVARAQLRLAFGTALSGQDWALDLRRSALRRIRVLRQR